jgi:hypothetical protein
MATPLDDLKKQLKAIETLLTRHPRLSVPEEVQEQAQRALQRLTAAQPAPLDRAKTTNPNRLKSLTQAEDEKQTMQCPDCGVFMKPSDFAGHRPQCRTRQKKHKRNGNTAESPSTPIEKLPSVSESGPEIWHRPTHSPDQPNPKSKKSKSSPAKSPGQIMADNPKVERNLDAAKDHWKIRDQGRFGGFATHDDYGEEGQL